MTTRYVVFSHGKESGPWGGKITTLAETARVEGYEVESVDYQGIESPRDRITKLVDTCKPLSGELVLVGSSLGAYVSLAAASFLHARGLFLMAPAVYAPGLPDLRKGVLDCPLTIVHGYHDDVVPYEQSLRLAQEYGAALHLVNGDHRLNANMRVIRYLFEYFLIALDLPGNGDDIIDIAPQGT